MLLKKACNIFDLNHNKIFLLYNEVIVAWIRCRHRCQKSDSITGSRNQAFDPDSYNDGESHYECVSSIRFGEEVDLPKSCETNKHTGAANHYVYNESQGKTNQKPPVPSKEDLAA